MQLLNKIIELGKSKIFFKGFRNLFIYFTLVFFGVNIIVIYGFGAKPDTSFTALGFTILSLAIACHAVVIAIESDEKMKSISTGDFFDLANRFWDRAPKLYQNLSYGSRDTQSWQLENLFRHAEKLKKWADPDVQGRLIKEFCTFLKRLRAQSCKKYWVEIKNYRKICKIAIDFKTNDNNVKDDLIKEISNWIGNKDKGESNREYLDRKSIELSDNNDNDVYTIVNLIIF
jgi:hypothetical protein